MADDEGLLAAYESVMDMVDSFERENVRLRAENERLRDILRACLRGMRRYDWDVLEDGVSMPYGKRTLREQIAREVDDG